MRRIPAAIGCLLLLSQAGCALVRYAFDPIVMPPHQSPPPAEQARAEAQADSMESVRIVVFPNLPPEFYQPARTATSPAKPDSIPKTEPTETPAPTEQPEITPPVEQPWISVDIPESERRRLIETTDRDLEETRAILRSIERRPMKPVDREKAETIHGLVDQAMAARDRQDLRGASRLAHKARLLAFELGNRPAR